MSQKNERYMRLGDFLTIAVSIIPVNVSQMFLDTKFKLNQVD